MKATKRVTLSFNVTIEEAEEFDRVLGSSEYPVNRSAVLRNMFSDWLKERQRKEVSHD